ncbi:glycosyltransferase [Streptomyces sp. MNU76]|uniref:glycosyltransferase n=1 Tax=Streptomyces sp. MNU76 TaxID=2560026 RepID=UPI001E4BA69B|nr:glycosyltransferase [Streptomyces sp. MNU76]MCC9710659.1 glycosyltransferase [Streptomyces sp. MNU76]
MSGELDRALPDVSVIVGAYNAMPYLTRCVTSVVEQTLGRERLELIVIDDGSTDGTAAELDRLAAEFPDAVHVVHQENSGGPSAPRNAGLDLARGRYVFFLDADDYLGPEALERMVAMADAQGSDVVLGKMVGVGGRGAPQSMFRRNQPKADLFTSRVYWTLSPLKLFRRDLIERLGLRFRTDFRVGEDQPFVAMAYLHAAVISVVADYDCYYWVERDDGNNVTLTTRGTHPRLRFLRVMFDLLSREVEAGPRRDLLVRRHLEIDLNGALVHLVRETEPDIRDSALTEIRQMLDAWCTDELGEQLPAMTRLRFHLARRGMLEELREVISFDRSGRRHKAVIDKGRAFGAYPFFRDPERGVPDACFDITEQLPVRHHLATVALTGTELHLSGHAYIHRVDTTETATEVLLRERSGAGEYCFPADALATPALTSAEGEGIYDYDRAGFTLRVDVATAADGRPLPPGLWDVFLSVRSQGIDKEARFGSRCADDVDSRPQLHLTRLDDGATRVVTPYFTKPYGNLTLDIGEQKHRLSSHLKMNKAAWADSVPGTLELTGSTGIHGLAPDDLTVRATRGGDSVELGAFLDVELSSPGSFTLRLDLARAVRRRRLTPGDWELAVQLRRPGLALTLPVPYNPALPDARLRRHGPSGYAKPLPHQGLLALRISTVDAGAAVRRRLRRIRRVLTAARNRRV